MNTQKKNIQKKNTLATELSGLLNRYSQENTSDTPDFVLANFLLACLEAYNNAICAREIWYGEKQVNFNKRYK